MRNLFENIIFLISQIAILILAIIWYYQDKDIEPLIVIIGAATAIIISLIFRFQKGKEERQTQSNLVAERMRATEGIKIKSSQKGDHKTEVRDLDSGGEINIEIDHE